MRHTKSRRDVVRLAATSLATLAAPGLKAQGLSARPVTIVVPYAAGGATDVIARLLAQHLEPRLSRTVLVDNRPGATTAVGTHYVVRAAPDGHTLLLTAPPLVIGAYAEPKPPYDAMRDLAPISLVTSSPLVVAVGPKVPASSIGEFLALVRSNPGKFNYGSTGIMGLPHVAAELLCKRAGLSMTHVPYRGGGQVMADLLSGQVETYLGNPVEVAPQRAMGVKALAVTSDQRSALMPDLPTMREAGVERYDFSTWTGLLAPAATDPALIARLNGFVSEILAEANVARILNEQFSTPEGGSTDRFKTFLTAQQRLIADAVKSL